MTIGETIRKAIKEVSKGVLDMIGPKDFKLTDDEVSDDIKYGMMAMEKPKPGTKKPSKPESIGEVSKKIARDLLLITD